MQVTGVSTGNVIVQRMTEVRTTLCNTKSTASVVYAVMDTHLEHVIIGLNAFSQFGIGLECSQPRQVVVAARLVIPAGTSKLLQVTGGVSTDTLFSEHHAVPDCYHMMDVQTVPVTNTSVEPLVFQKGLVIGVWHSNDSVSVNTLVAFHSDSSLRA
ncbi:unnamed protein product [Auanema sp. JU1783]|nr:unnamed protein product [Auanema sp. JU1783]